MKLVRALVASLALLFLAALPAKAVNLCNNAWMTTATTGTGTITLGSALAGYQTLAECGITDGQIVRYRIFDGSGWELGSGTYTSSGTTLSRTVAESSNSDAAISLSGTATVIITALVADLPSESTPTDTTAPGTDYFFGLESGVLKRFLFSDMLTSPEITTGLELDNASDTTITRSSAGVVAVEGVTVALNSTSATHTAGTVELGAATDTTLARSGAGAVTVEGVGVALNSTSLAHTASQYEVGNASDTTISRSAAGVIAVEGIPLRSTESFCVAASDESTAITTGTAKVTFRMPYAFTVTNLRASLNTVSSSGNPTFDINEGGTSIMGANKLSIDSSEKTSVTAATAYYSSDNSLADDAEMTIDVDTAGTGAKGIKICIIGYQT